MSDVAYQVCGVDKKMSHRGLMKFEMIPPPKKMGVPRSDIPPPRCKLFKKKKTTGDGVGKWGMWKTGKEGEPGKWEN